MKEKHRGMILLRAAGVSAPLTEVLRTVEGIEDVCGIRCGTFIHQGQQKYAAAAHASEVWSEVDPLCPIAIAHMRTPQSTTKEQG